MHMPQISRLLVLELPLTQSLSSLQPPPCKRRKHRGKSQSKELERLADLDEWFELTKASNKSNMLKHTYNIFLMLYLLFVIALS